VENLVQHDNFADSKLAMTKQTDKNDSNENPLIAHEARLTGAE
jgi:hypothetical protein